MLFETIWHMQLILFDIFSKFIIGALLQPESGVQQPFHRLRAPRARVPCAGAPGPVGRPARPAAVALAGGAGGRACVWAKT